MKRILVLGGGFLQLPLIKKAIALGYEVVVSDYYEKIIGKELSNYSETVSTFDVEANISVARKYNVKGILTCATDQPVLTAAKVAEKLHLPTLISVETAVKLTNKKYMKNALFENNIPTTRYDTTVDLEKCKRIAKELGYPVVIKPVDSQGQRGVYKIEKETQLEQLFNISKGFSRTSEVIIEEFYENEEISVQAWVVDCKPYILLITDRVTTDSDSNIGICLEHVYPSKYLKKYYDEVNDIIDKICNGFDVKNGPLYIQLLIGKQGIKVGELGGRIGGANEVYMVKAVTGIDMCELLLKQYFNQNLDITSLDKLNILRNEKHAIMKWVFGKPGIVKCINSDDFFDKGNLYKGGIFINNGTEIGKLSGTQKLGYLLVVDNSFDKTRREIYNIYNSLKIMGENGENLVAFIDRDEYEKHIN